MLGDRSGIAFVGVALTLGTLACSDDGPSSSQVGTAGTTTGGAGGSGGGLALGGTGGATGGTGGSVTAGNNPGTAGSGPEVPVFNPALPMPSRDCRNEPLLQCLAIRGTLLGEPLDESCTKSASAGTFGSNPGAWPMPCYENLEMPDASVGLFFQVEVPIGPPGPFHQTRDNMSDDNGLNLVVTKDRVGGEASQRNLKLLEMSGTISFDESTRNHVATGTYRATWDVPENNCLGDCGEADVHGSFRIVNALPSR